MQMIRMPLIASLLMLVAVTAGSHLAVALEPSGPIVASRDGQVIENVRIEAVGRPAILVDGFSNVTIRDIEILHQGAPGISCSHASGLIIENVSIIHIGEDTESAEESNISCYRSDGLRVRNARLRGGSAGVYVLESANARLSYLEGYDFRGPDPRGQLVQFNKSPNCILEDFSAINDPEVASTADNVSVYYSDNCVMRRGFLDGNNAPSGVGVMFENSRNGLAEDIDTVAQGNGSFSAYPGHHITFRRTRARDNICEDQGRGAPASNALVWAGSPDSTALRIEDSAYFNLCNPSNLVWDRSSFEIVQITREDFQPRPPIELNLAWENGGPIPLIRNQAPTRPRTPTLKPVGTLESGHQQDPPAVSVPFEERAEEPCRMDTSFAGLVARRGNETMVGQLPAAGGCSGWTPWPDC